MQYRPDIDGLRCIAVMLVVLFHIQLWPISGGYIGVDVFFVISGFLVTKVICHSIEKKTFRFSNFYARRIRRLFPAVFFTVIASLIAGWFLFPPDAFSDLAQSSIATLFSASNVYFWFTSGYFETSAHYKPLLHTWSLAIEEQFYLVWPVSIVLLAGAAINRKRVLTVLILTVIISTMLAEWAIRSNQMTASFFLLPFRMNEFAMGALVSFLPSLKTRGGNNILALFGLAGVLVPSVVFTSNTVFPGINAMLPCLATAMLIYAGRETIVASILSLRLFTYIGKVSYSFYLAHWPVIAFYLFWRGSAVDLLLHEQVILFAVSLGLGMLMYHFVETPFRLSKGTAKIAPNLTNNGVGLWFTSSTLFVVLASAFVWGNQGVPQRYDDNKVIAQLLKSMDPLVSAEMKIKRNSQKGKRKVLFYGDSHAGVTQEAFLDWAAKNNATLKISGIGGCVPLVGVQTTSGKNQKKCLKRNNQLKTINYADYDMVILLSRWGLYTAKSTQEGGRFGRHASPILSVNDKTVSTDLDTSRKFFREILSEMVAQINNAGTPVLFVGQVPHVGKDPKPCVARSFTLKDVEKNCNGATMESALAESSWSLAAAQNIEGLNVFDPNPLFCKDGVCKLTKDGNMLYRDADHLSSSGAKYLVEELSPTLKQLMGK